MLHSDKEAYFRTKMASKISSSLIPSTFVVVVVQLLSCVQLFTTPWAAACQTPLSFTASWSLLKLMSIESVMPSNHFILCHPLLTLALKTPILWLPNAKSWFIGKDPDAGKDWGGEGNRGWDGWITSLTQWTWAWANSRRWWRTGKPGVLQSMGSQRVRGYWTELN